MKRELIITSLGLMFSYPVLADIPANELEQLKNQYAPVIQQLKENPPNITKELDAVNDKDIQVAATEPKNVTLDFSQPDFDAILKNHSNH